MPKPKKQQVGIKRALVNLSVDQLNVPVNILTDMIWTNEVFDIGDFHDVGSPELFTIPSGVAVVRMAVNLRWESLTPHSVSRKILTITRGDGTTVPGLPAIDYRTNRIGISNARGNMISAPIEVSEGDQFKVRVRHNESLPIDVVAAEDTWFSIQALE